MYVNQSLNNIDRIFVKTEIKKGQGILLALQLVTKQR